MSSSEKIVGRVLRASTRGFDCGAHSRNINDIHDFGTFVKVPIANDNTTHAIGLIYKVEIKDDQLISELVLGDEVSDSILRDQRDNRMIPVEIKVLCVGYMNYDGNVVQTMPPRPPMSLSDVWQCTAEEIHQFVQRLDFFRMVLNASEVPSDDLLASTIRYTASIYVGDENYHRQFLVGCGRRIARELSNDHKRLAYILSLISP
jgi:hypothetical protein